MEGLKLKEAIPLGLQHVLAMFVGNVTPLIIISGALGLSLDDKTMLVQCANASVWASNISSVL
ncbi:hypothetical protein Q5M85_17790 [Paraclostridium bifermentans]|nr:hypothetical protein [Paraclostridium bifermentans]